MRSLEDIYELGRMLDVVSQMEVKRFGGHDRFALGMQGRLANDAEFQPLMSIAVQVSNIQLLRYILGLPVESAFKQRLNQLRQEFAVQGTTDFPLRIPDHLIKQQESVSRTKLPPSQKKPKPVKKGKKDAIKGRKPTKRRKVSKGR